MSDHGNMNPGNFANRPTKDVQAIATKGGHNSHKNDNVDIAVADLTSPAENTNLGNFANRPAEEVKEIASMGGKASHKGGFDKMDPKEVEEIKAGHGTGEHDNSHFSPTSTYNTISTNLGNFANRDKEEVSAIAAKGGQQLLILPERVTSTQGRW